jgi:iron-sulfur cluster assembly protein
MNTPVTLSDKAAEQINRLVNDQGDDAHAIRLGIRKRGCSGMSYTMDFVNADQAGEAGDRIEKNGATLYVDPAAVMFLFGTEIDYQEDDLQSGFVFNNPNEAGRCGCGESFHTDDT